MWGNNSNGSNGFYMPVAPAYSGYGNNGGFFGGDGGWWVLLLILAFMNGGWGGFGMGGMGGMMWPMMMGMGGGFGLDYLYPWLNNSQHISDGFRDQALQTSIGALQNSVTSGFGDVQTSLCSGFAGVNATVNSGVNTLSQQMNANQLAALERSFAAQTANLQGLNALQSALQQCCCDNRAATADLKFTVATEACADRAAVGDALQAVTMQGYQNTNALLTAFKDGVQSIKDELCADRLDAERRDNANLRAELMYARGQASQVEQTAALRAAQATTANQLVSELRSCPIPSYSVYGNQPVFQCSGPAWNNNGCGCPGNNGYYGFAG